MQFEPARWSYQVLSPCDRKIQDLQASNEDSPRAVKKCDQDVLEGLKHQKSQQAKECDIQDSVISIIYIKMKFTGDYIVYEV